MPAIHAVFKKEGTLTCRGEEAFRFSVGDTCFILQEETEAPDLCQIVFSSGEAKGTIAYLNKDEYLEVVEDE